MLPHVLRQAAPLVICGEALYLRSGMEVKTSGRESVRLESERR